MSDALDPRWPRTLLAALQPVRHPGSWVFVLAPGGRAAAAGPALRPVAAVQEDEGLTLVVTREAADAAGLEYGPVLARIELRVRSQLDDVGLTAAVSTRLAAAGISCNVVAGLHHDWLYVPEGRAAEAVAHLEELSASARGPG